MDSVPRRSVTTMNTRTWIFIAALSATCAAAQNIVIKSGDLSVALDPEFPRVIITIYLSLSMSIPPARRFWEASVPGSALHSATLRCVLRLPLRLPKIESLATPTLIPNP